MHMNAVNSDFGVKTNLKSAVILSISTIVFERYPHYIVQAGLDLVFLYCNNAGITELHNQPNYISEHLKCQDTSIRKLDIHKGCSII